METYSYVLKGEIRMDLIEAKMLTREEVLDLYKASLQAYAIVKTRPATSTYDPSTEFEKAMTYYASALEKGIYR